jgi:hypothetical protein
MCGVSRSDVGTCPGCNNTDLCHSCFFACHGADKASTRAFAAKQRKQLESKSSLQAPAVAVAATAAAAAAGQASAKTRKRKFAAAAAAVTAASSSRLSTSTPSSSPVQPQRSAKRIKLTDTRRTI